MVVLAVTAVCSVCLASAKGVPAHRAQAGQRECNVDKLQGLVGQTINVTLVEQIQQQAGAEQVRVLAPRAPATMDYNPQRLNIDIDDAEVIEVGNLRIHAIHNPGHTEGSISFAVANTPLLFTGDTLFPGGPGNTSLEGGNFATIIQSIDNKLFTFPPDTIVLPGHGLDTTIGTERPHLQTWVDRGW